MLTANQVVTIMEDNTNAASVNIGIDNYVNTTTPSLQAGNLQNGYGVVCFLCFIFAIINNTVYITVTLKTPALRNPIRSCLTIALSVADMMSMTAIMLQLVTRAVGDANYRPSDYLWPFYCTFTWQASILLIISAERFVAVMKPLHYHMWITMNRLMAALAVSALLSLAFSLTTFACRSRTLKEAAIIANEEYRVIPAIKDIFPKEFFMFRYVYIALYIAIGMAICALYVPVLFSIRIQLRKSATAECSYENVHQQVRRKHKGTIMLSVVIIYFFVVGFGNLIWWTVPSFYTWPFGQAGLIFNVTSFLAFLSFSPAVFNPILYGFVNKSFRNALRSCCRCKPNVIEEEPTVIPITFRNRKHATHI